MTLFKPTQFLKLDRSLLLRERKLLNILLNQLCLHLLSTEKEILINDTSVYQIALNASYVNLLLKTANINTRVELKTIINDLSNKNIQTKKEDRSLNLINQLSIEGSEVVFSINPSLNHSCNPQAVFTIDESIHNSIKKKNPLIIYELCRWKISLNAQGLKRESKLINDEEIIFNIDILDLKDYFGVDAYQNIPTGQFSRSVLKPAIDYLNTINQGFGVQIIPQKEIKVITHYTFNVKVNDALQLNTLLFS